MSERIVRGQALIFWDLKIPGKKKKLDAIDTDQITPAADCVSESLDTLDERWKAGSFRYLMPDFRRRVVARNESRRAEGCCRRSRSAAGRRVRQQHGRHLPAQRVEPGPSRRPE